MVGSSVGECALVTNHSQPLTGFMPGLEPTPTPALFAALAPAKPLRDGVRTERVLVAQSGNNVAPKHNASRTTPLPGKSHHLEDFEPETRHMHCYPLAIRDY